MKYINIACGNSFVTSPGWINFDFTANSQGIIASDLLNSLPLPNNCCDVLYSSHFFEHIPLKHLTNVLSEWFRVLKPNGIVRLVLPNCEEMFCEYLRLRAASQHDLADFVIAEIIDQCVRTYPGGRLGYFYAQAANSSIQDDSFANFIKSRNGEDLSYFSSLNSRPISQVDQSLLRKYFLRIRSKIRQTSMSLQRRLRIFLLQLIFKPAFIEQNISFANIGERHHWLWDFYQVSQILHEIGFVLITRRTHNTSSIPDFPFFPLDQFSDGTPRKGNESMFIEAVKPPGAY